MGLGGVWKLGGNGVTDPATEWLGTSSAEALEVRVNGLRAVRIEPTNPDAAPNIIGGHRSNAATAGAVGATVGGGGYDDGVTVQPNRVTDIYGTVGGGRLNRAGSDDADAGNAPSATVGGGADNAAGGSWSTVGGGGSNTASDSGSTVGGGAINTADGVYSTVGGGYWSTASGSYSTVPGGEYNAAQGDWSFAAGYRAKANHQGAFVWADSTDANFESTGADQFLVRAAGGVGVNTANPGSALHVAGPVTTATNNVSADYTLTDTDSELFVDATAAVTVTLPAASASTVGRVYYVYKVTGSNAVSLAPSGADAVHGATSTTTQWSCLRIVGYSSTEWISTGP